MRVAQNGAAQLRFPAISTRTAQCLLQLPPFAGFPDGWSGTLEEFLTDVREQRIELQQSPLAAVVDQYLAHRGSLALNEAGEFLHMASWLIDCKARLLLPCNPDLSRPDARQEIVRTLEGDDHEISSEEISTPSAGTVDLCPRGLSLLDLMILLNEVEQNMLASEVCVLTRPEVTVFDQLQWMAERLSQLSREPENIEPLFMVHASGSAKICLFLALLELSKQGQIRLEQQWPFGPITVRRS